MNTVEKSCVCAAIVAHGIVFVIVVALALGDEGLSQPLSGPEAAKLLDIDIDSNNDGTIDNHNNNEDIYESHAPGRIICVDRSADGSNRDHLVPMKLAPTGAREGTLTLSLFYGASCVRIWDNADKTGMPILTPPTTVSKTWNFETESAPPQLYVDGIAPGTVIIRLSYSYTPSGQPPVVTTDALYCTVHPTVSRSPSVSLLRIWEPAAFHVTSHAQAELIDRLSPYGWPSTGPDLLWCSDRVADDDCENCTLENFVAMRDGGILYVGAHGMLNESGGGGIQVVYRPTTQQCAEWVGTETDPHMHTGLWDYRIKMSVVSADAEWFDAHWAPSLTSLESFVWLWSCESAMHNPSMLERIGGRVAFGYNGSPTAQADISNIHSVLQKMLGAPPGRSALEAYNACPKAVGLQMRGNGWTTFHPAPILAVSTGESVFSCGCAGIYLDSYLANTSANEAITQSAGGSGTIGTRRYVGNGSGNFGIAFDFSNAAGATGRSVTANANVITCPALGTGTGRRMAGDGITYGANRSWALTP